MKLHQHLNKLISEEILAFEAYKRITLIINSILEKAKSGKKVFKISIKEIDSLAEDEYDDHAKKLIKFAKDRHLSFPSAHTDYSKYAGNTCLFMANNIPDDEDVMFYIKYVYDMEKDAISSYEDSVDESVRLHLDKKLINLLMHNLKDEHEHAERMLKLLDDGSVKESFERYARDKIILEARDELDDMD